MNYSKMMAQTKHIMPIIKNMPFSVGFLNDTNILWEEIKKLALR